MNMSSGGGEMSDAIEWAPAQQGTDARESDGDEMDFTARSNLTSSAVKTEGSVHFAEWWREYQRKMKARFQITELKLQAQVMA
jgi:hypothetical protein